MRQSRAPLINLVGNLLYRSNIRVDRKAHADFISQCGNFLTRQVDSKKNRCLLGVGKLIVRPTGIPEQWTAVVNAAI